MEKKSVSATILVLFLALTFSVIGICFVVFVYEETKIIINQVNVSANGVKVYGDKDLKNEVTKLDLSDMNLGLKPATGKLDSDTQIPSTINDQGTSEGYYATVYVPAGTNFKILIKNIVIETKKNEGAVKEERENIFVAIKGLQKAIKSLEDDEIELAKYENVNENSKITFLIWLSSLAGEDLVGAKISFTLEFQSY